MSDNTPLGERMKRYEHTFRHILPRRSYTLMRLDGVAFHNYLRHADKPFDTGFIADMDNTMQYLCEMIQGVKLAYVQSDEISLLITDFDTIQTRPWHGGVVQKLTSVSAGRASAYLARLRHIIPDLPAFDCRVWSMSDPVEVANYFIWRQQDAVRNSIQMVGQHYFTHRELQGVSGNEIQEMLFSRHGINWNDFSAGCKRGRVAVRTQEEGWCTFAAPHFKAEPGAFLSWHIPALPSLND